MKPKDLDLRTSLTVSLSPSLSVIKLKKKEKMQLSLGTSLNQETEETPLVDRRHFLLLPVESLVPFPESDEFVSSLPHF